jgi:predicted RNase H-like HicB family nuclease
MTLGRPRDAGEGLLTLEYHAAYYQNPEDDGWYVVQLLDFPGVLSQGRTLKSARRMIRDALRLMAECLVEERRPLPRPNPRAKDKRAMYAETIPLRIRISCGTKS